MKLAAIHVSRVSYFLDIVDLVSSGRVFLPDLVTAIAEHCEFRKFPQNFGKENETKGAVFEIGKFGNQPITKLTIFNDGVVLETNSSTDVTEETLLAMLAWAKSASGLQFEPEMVKRKVFFSQLTAYLEVTLDSVHPIFGEISKELSKSNSDLYQQPMAFRTSGITLGVNTLTAKFLPAAFSIERRIDVPDTENKYFCSAPLTTGEHIALLEKFEKALQRLPSTHN